MPFCRDCMKLEDALEAVTLQYDELLIQKTGGAEQLAQLRRKRDDLQKQLMDHKVTHTAATA